MLFDFLLATHVILTTIGYGGLLATNLFFIQFFGAAHSGDSLSDAVTAWRRLAGFFGPLLGLGTLFGFWLATVVHAPLASFWLVLSYALIVFALSVQAAIMIPWQVRTERIILAGGNASAVPVAVIVAVFAIVYACIVILMLLRPSGFP